MKPTTLCFPINKKGHILLGMKRRGFGAGKYNGFGGKIVQGESFRQCALREMAEEVSLIGREEDLEAIAFIDFRFPFEPELTHIGYVYVIRKWLGTPLESEEMDPQWFAPEALPYEAMWKGDCAWLPLLLKGKKLIGHVTFGEDNDTVIDMYFEEVAYISELEHTFAE